MNEPEPGEWPLVSCLPSIGHRFLVKGLWVLWSWLCTLKHRESGDTEPQWAAGYERRRWGHWAPGHLTVGTERVFGKSRFHMPKSTWLPWCFSELWAWQHVWGMSPMEDICVALLFCPIWSACLTEPHMPHVSFLGTTCCCPLPVIFPKVVGRFERPYWNKQKENTFVALNLKCASWVLDSTIKPPGCNAEELL